jgi:ABC-type polysaccharide/polyol phosphate transport system ATPase subunit
MSLIQLENADLVYPVRENRGMTLKEFVVRGIFRQKLIEKRKTVQALTGINLRIADGERVGIIGHNGAGKSTLLRTIAGVFPISSGRRTIDGKICSLFDIAVGFEPAATGWQNIRFRSYLQGETPQALREKAQSIGEFSELKEFLDLPICCYSTGMTTRLAFAIATSSDPEIMLIDEIFSAGDLAFQKKAEARMQDLMHKAQIVVMVAHHLEFLEKFCTRLLWLQRGQIIADGPAKEIIDRYRQTGGQLPLAA